MSYKTFLASYNFNGTQWNVGTANIISPDKVDALVGTYGRAGFIREAVERELTRRETKP